MGSAGGRSAPLIGVRVLDLTHFLSGPFCTLILAQLGAEVVKVERPRLGDPYRRHGPVLTGSDGRTVRTDFVHLNHTKKSVAIDLSTEAGRQLVERLAGRSDVLVENFRPSVMDRMGLGWSSLREVNPRLIYASVSGFGHHDLMSSPYAERPAFNMIAQAMSGIVEVTGSADGPPVPAAVPIGDFVPALYLTIGILAALEHRRRTGRGQLIDVAMYDALIPFIVRPIVKYQATGQVQRRGEEILHSAVGVFRASDGYVALSALGDEMWRRTCAAIERPELASDPRFDTDSKRGLVWAAELVPLFEEWASKRTKREATDALLACDVPCGPVNNARDIVEDPHVAARRMLVEVGDTVGGSLLVPASPIKFSGMEEIPPGEPRPLGADTGDVLRELLDLDEAAIEGLRHAGAIDE